MSIEGQGHFLTLFFQVLYILCLYEAHISGERLQDHWSSGLNLQVTRPCIIPRMNSNFGLIEPLNTELAACVSKMYYSKHFEGFTCWLSDERPLPFGLLVISCKTFHVRTRLGNYNKIRAKLNFSSIDVSFTNAYVCTSTNSKEEKKRSLSCHSSIILKNVRCSFLYFHILKIKFTLMVCI